MDTAFPHHSITKICKAAPAAELITYDSSTKMTQPHDSTPQLFQPRKRRSNAFKYPGRALLSVQFTTSLTSLISNWPPGLHKPHKLLHSVIKKIFNIKFQENKENKIKKKKIKILLFQNSAKIKKKGIYFFQIIIF